MNVITLTQLSKNYEDGKKAVDHVNIRLQSGEIFGFLGPNGAGKTTTVKLLNGMLTPSYGSSRILGIDPAIHPEKVHNISGVVTEHAQMYDHLTGIQNLIFYGSLFGIEPGESKRRGNILLEQLELLDDKDKKLATYSTGMRQKLSLARALIHEPRILFLDEPTSGLDPKSAQNVHSMIQNLSKEKGMTIFLCTHQLRYAQEICTHFGLMDHGHLIADGSLEELRSKLYSGIKVKMKVYGGIFPLPYRKIDGCTYEITVNTEEEIPTIVRKIVETGGKVYNIFTELPSLEDIYFKLILRRKEKLK